MESSLWRGPIGRLEPAWLAALAAQPEPELACERAPAGPMAAWRDCGWERWCSVSGPKHEIVRPARTERSAPALSSQWSGLTP